MGRVGFGLIAVATPIGVVICTTPSSQQAAGQGAPIFVTEIPPAYRDWRLISVAHEAAKLNDIRGILGNDLAIKTYREGKLPFPVGTIIARVAWSFDASDENNKVFGQNQSFVAGVPKNGIQFMVKESKKYAATGGWGMAISKMENLLTRSCSTPAFPVTRLSRIATSSSPVTHLDPPSNKKRDDDHVQINFNTNQENEHYSEGKNLGPKPSYTSRLRVVS